MTSHRRQPRHTHSVSSASMGHADLLETTEAAVKLARNRPDSWISVSAELGRLISGGTTLSSLVQALRDEASDTLEFEHRGLCAGQGPSGDSFTVIDATSSEYPSDLHVIDGRPLLLYVKGNLPRVPRASLAIVGSRKATHVGRDAAFKIAAEVARAGHPVVSGLAQGIDTAAHRGALSVGGVTVAVMGTGIDQIFPSENAGLAESIAVDGAIVSQFAPGQGPSKTTFPARNAIIAGLSDASLLVQLEERSGTRIEAERALEQGKPVWLWGPIMAGADWAQSYAKRRGVSFVSSVDEILHKLAALKAQ